MSLSEDVAALELRCEELGQQVDKMTDDPVVDFVTLYVGAKGVEVAYGIKGWEWEGEYPRISIAQAVRDEVRLALEFPGDAGENREFLSGLIGAFQLHIGALEAGLVELERKFPRTEAAQ